MDSSLLLGITTFAYLLAAIIYIGVFVFRAKRFSSVATTVTALAFLVNTAGIGLRWVESHQMGIGYAPIAWFAIIGFSSVMFTYYGVNYLLPGLHSYG